MEPVFRNKIIWQLACGNAAGFNGFLNFLEIYNMPRAAEICNSSVSGESADSWSGGGVKDKQILRATCKLLKFPQTREIFANIKTHDVFRKIQVV